MKRQLLQVAPVLLSAIFLAAGAVSANAQITDPIRAHIDHSFVAGEKTMPAGDYTFRMVQGSDLQVMQMTNEHTHTSAEFPVIPSQSDHTPKHSEVVFRRYGNTDFLYKVYEMGIQGGVRTTETSKQEKKFVSSGQQPTEHTEEQQ